MPTRLWPLAAFFSLLLNSQLGCGIVQRTKRPLGSGDWSAACPIDAQVSASFQPRAASGSANMLRAYDKRTQAFVPIGEKSDDPVADTLECEIDSLCANVQMPHRQ